MMFDTLELAEAYCKRYESAPDRSIGPIHPVKMSDGSVKYQINIRWWSLD